MNRGIIAMLIPLTAFALAACTSTPVPTKPAKLVTVEKGASSFESDSRVISIRASFLAQARAANSGDYSLSELASSTSSGTIDSLFQQFHYRYLTQKRAPFVVPGPILFLPTGVRTTSNGAVVSACQVSTDWYTTPSHAATYDLASGTKVEYDLSKSSKSRVLQFSGTSNFSEKCDATGALVQKFDPAPKLPTKWTESEVRAPAGYSN